MPRPRICGVALLAVTFGLLAAAPARAGSWQNSFSGFGAILQGDLYAPTTPAASPAVLVAIHMCTGHSTTVRGWFDSYADKQGFYIIAPDAGKQCFDSSATRDGDKAAIVKMVN
jgi:poly(3-hydroxybutyrate) depolymerase